SAPAFVCKESEQPFREKTPQFTRLGSNPDLPVFGSLVEHESSVLGHTVTVLAGIDSINAYTKKDFKNLKGSTELRRQVRLPKAHLGFCIPLAMESNGTIFSAKKLELTRKNAVKKFVTVFTRRVAMTAVPCQCQKCECTADNDGMSYMECFPCQYPTPGFYNFIHLSGNAVSFIKPYGHICNILMAGKWVDERIIGICNIVEVKYYFNVFIGENTLQYAKYKPDKLNLNLDKHQLYDKFCEFQTAYPRLDKSKAEDKIWVEFFNRQTTIDVSYSQLLKLMSFIFSIPISKSFAERIFSVMKNQ
ncbi:unnamed protein product, partial [Timema podura]|nr:unnamed protein product [Timema podura]